MKKILITLLFFICSFIASSQFDAYAVSLTVGFRDNSLQEFSWGDTKVLSSNIPIKFNDKDITIYTEDIQYYQTLMPEYKVDSGSYWFAFDVKMKKCKFYMVNQNGQNFIVIEYDDACIIYGVFYE